MDSYDVSTLACDFLLSTVCETQPDWGGHRGAGHPLSLQYSVPRVDLPQVLIPLLMGMGVFPMRGSYKHCCCEESGTCRGQWENICTRFWPVNT